MSIDYLNGCCSVNRNGYSVYDFNHNTVQQLLCEFFTKINECVDSSNKALEFMEWVKEEGLPLEVVKYLNQMLEDGTLADLINKTIFEDLNSQLENIVQQLTLIDLININLKENSVVKTNGYYNINDGGGACYTVDSIDRGIGIKLNNGLYLNFIGNKLSSLQLGINSDKDGNFIKLRKLSSYINSLNSSFSFEINCDINVRNTTSKPIQTVGVLEIVGKRNITIYSNNYNKYYCHDHNISENSGIVLVRFINCSDCECYGIDFEVTAFGKNELSSYYPLLGCIHCDIEDNNLSKYCNSINIHGNRFKTFHPQGASSTTSNPFNGDNNNGHKMMTVWFNGNTGYYTNGYGYNKTHTCKDNVIKYGNNGYGFWSMCCEVDFIGNRAINYAGTYPLIRYMLLENMNVKIENNKFTFLTPSQNDLSNSFNDVVVGEGVSFINNHSNNTINVNVNVKNNTFVQSYKCAVQINERLKGIKIDVSNIFTEDVEYHNKTNFETIQYGIFVRGEGGTGNHLSGTFSYFSNRGDITGTKAYTSKGKTVLSPLSVLGELQTNGKASIYESVKVFNSLDNEKGIEIFKDDTKIFELKNNSDNKSVVLRIPNSNYEFYFGKEVNQGVSIKKDNKWYSIDTSEYKICGSSSRPTGSFVYPGMSCLDLDLMKPIWHKGNNIWVDSTGTVV